MSEPVPLRQHGNAALAMPLDALLAARTVWRAGHGTATANGGESTGHAALDAVPVSYTHLTLPTICSV